MTAVDSASVPPLLHELERKVMDHLWTLGEGSVREVLQAVNATSSRELAYTTIMTILQRLDRKQVVKRRREGKTDFYKPAMTRAEYSEARAAAEVGALVENYGEAALVHFARQMNQLDSKRQEQLRRLAGRE